MNRVVLLLVIPLVGVGLASQAAEAQRSGSLQAIARVLDTRDSWAGLQRARTAASWLSHAPQSSTTVETSLITISVEQQALPRRLERPPRTFIVTINYLRN